MKLAALGFRVHSGWTAAVVVTGPADSPAIAVRQRIELVKTFTYTYRQPYHTGKKMPLKDAAKFVAECRAEARKLALSALRTLEKELEGMNVKIRGCGLVLASGRPLPRLEQILASHALIHTADGELFREALTHACVKRGLPVRGVKERELFERASKSLRLRPEALQRRIAEFGRGLGPPWGQDEKFSALVGWLTLADA
jgi:hypothetical protein